MVAKPAWAQANTINYSNTNKKGRLGVRGQGQRAEGVEEKTAWIKSRGN